MIENKIEAYSFIATSILLAGLMRLYIYFKSFGISIIPFIKLEEVTLLVQDNVLYFLIFLLLNMFVILLFYNKSSDNKGLLKR